MRSTIILGTLVLLAFSVGLNLATLDHATADCPSPAGQFFTWKQAGGCSDINYTNCIVANSGALDFSSTQGLAWCYNNPPTQGWVELASGGTDHIENIDFDPDYWQPFVEAGAGVVKDPFNVEWSGNLIDDTEDGTLNVDAVHWPGRLGQSTDERTKVLNVLRP